MQTEYVDKHAELLEKAIETGERICSEDADIVPAMRLLGMCETKYEKRFYYEFNGKYYYESEFARYMRKKIQQNRNKRFTKK